MASIHNDSSIIHLTYGFFPVMKEKKQTRGKWCYEVTYLSGSKCFAAGFGTEKQNRFAFYGRAGNPNLFYTSDNYIDLGFQSTAYLFTYSLLIDIDAHTFTILHNSETYSFDFSSLAKGNDKWGVFVNGGCNTKSEDDVWVNLGERKFSNQIPKDYKPWIETLKKRNTCMQMRCDDRIRLFFVIFLGIDSR